MQHFWMSDHKMNDRSLFLGYQDILLFQYVNLNITEG